MSDEIDAIFRVTSYMNTANRAAIGFSHTDFIHLLWNTVTYSSICAVAICVQVMKLLLILLLILQLLFVLLREHQLFYYFFYYFYISYYYY